MPNFIMTPLISFFGALTGSSVAATVLAHITVAGVSMVGANLLMPKVDFGQAQTRQSLNVRGRNQRNATTNRQYIYGQVKVGGTVAYMGVTDTDNKFLHMVLVHCDHEVEELGDLYVNGELVPMVSGGEGVLRTTDTSSTFGTSLADRYNGSLYIADHLGGPNQTTADSTLNNATGDIGSSDAFKGMAYTYIRMELKQGEENAFPSGIPQFQRVIKGMKVYDPRESGHDPDDSTTWEYSSNWALCVAHFLQSDFGYGRYGLNYDKINESELIASANNSDDSINELWKAWQANETLETGGFTRSLGGFLLYSGTTTGTTGATAPNLTGLGVDDTVVDNDITWTLSYDDINTGTRYELNGMVDSHEDPIEVLRKMKTAASGMIEYIGGEWFVRSGRYIAPTVTLSESDFVTGISGTTKDDRTNAVNTVKGVIVDKHDFYNVIDAPSVTNSTFVTQDGGVESVKEMELLFTNSHKAAQRLFKIDLNKSRQSISHKASFTSKAMQLQVGDNFYLNFAKYGYSNKLFQVWSHQLVINEGALQVEMEFRETATNVYDWDHTTDETALDPAPNTNLPDPFEVTAPTGMTATSGTDQLIEASDGTVLPTVLLTWTESASVNVIGYQIRWKYANDSNDTQYRYITVNGKNNTSSVITGVKESRGNANHYIDIDIRSLTSVKAGEWTVVEHDHNVLGKSEAPTDPSGPTVSAVENGVTVTFSEHPDLDFFNYHIWVQTSSSPPTHTGTGPFSPLATTSTSGLTKTILGLDPSTTYYVFTAAMDSSRLFSDIVATTPATISPSAIAASDVTGLGALATEDTVDLTTTSDGGVSGVLPVANSEADVTEDAVESSISVTTGGIDMSGTSAIEANYVADTSGFKITGAGDAEFNNAKIRGDLLAGTIDIGTDAFEVQSDGHVSIGMDKETQGTIDDGAAHINAGDGLQLFAYSGDSGQSQSGIEYKNASGTKASKLAAASGTNNSSTFRVWDGSDWKFSGKSGFRTKEAGNTSNSNVYSNYQIQTVNSSGSTTDFIFEDDKLWFRGTGLGPQDTNLYRDAADVLRTDDLLKVGLGVTSYGGIDIDETATAQLRMFNRSNVNDSNDYWDIRHANGGQLQVLYRDNSAADWDHYTEFMEDGSILIQQNALRLWNYTSANSDITSLTTGSTFGALIEGDQSGHLVLGIRGNDSSDGLYIIKDETNSSGRGSYDTMLLRVDSNVGVQTGNAINLEVQGNTKTNLYHSTLNDGYAYFRYGSSTIVDFQLRVNSGNLEYSVNAGSSWNTIATV